MVPEQAHYLCPVMGGVVADVKKYVPYTVFKWFTFGIGVGDKFIHFPVAQDFESMGMIVQNNCRNSAHFMQIIQMIARRSGLNAGIPNVVRIEYMTKEEVGFRRQNFVIPFQLSMQFLIEFELVVKNVFERSHAMRHLPTKIKGAQ